MKKPSFLLTSNPRFSKVGFLFCLSMLVGLSAARAALVVSAQTGDWNLGTTWVGGSVPLATDDVEIAAGHSVTISDNQTCNNLTVTGTLTKNAGAAISLVITGSAIVTGSLISMDVNITIGSATSVSGIFQITGPGSLSLLNFSLLPAGLCTFTDVEMSFGTGCSLQGRIEASAATATGNALNFNAGSTCPDGYLWVKKGKATDNVGINPDSIKLGSGVANVYGIYSGTMSITIPTLVLNHGQIEGSGTIIVTDGFRGLASASGYNNQLLGSRQLILSGANNSMRSKIYIENNAKLVLEVNNSLSLGGSTGASLGHIIASTNGAVEFKNGSTITNLNSTYIDIEPNLTSTGATFSGKFRFGGAYYTPTFYKHKFNFTGGTLNGSVQFGGSSSGTTDTVNINNVAVLGAVFDVGVVKNGLNSFPFVRFNSGSIANSVAFKLKGGYFADNVGLTFPNVVNFEKGTFGGPANTVFTGGISMLYTTNASASLFFGGSGIVSINGPITGFANFDILNTKEVRIAGTADILGINLRDSSRLTLMAGSTVNMVGVGGGGNTPGYTFRLFEQQTGSTWNVVNSYSVFGTIAINALIKGTVNANSGYLLLDSSPTYSPVNFNGATLNIPVNKTIDCNSGTITFTNTAISGLGTLNIDATANFYAGSSVATKLTVNGTVTDDVGIMPGAFTMTPITAQYKGTGSPTFANGFTWDGGIFLGSGTVYVTSTATLGANSKSINGTKTVQFSNTLAATTTGTTSVGSTGKIILANGAVANISNQDISISADAAAIEIQNGAILNKTGTSTKTLWVNLLAGGTINVNAGILKLTSAAASRTYAGNINIASGATLQNLKGFDFTGSLLTNNGLFESPNASYHVNMNGGASQTLAGNGRFTRLFASGITISGSQRILNAFNFTGGAVALQNGDLTVGSITGASSTNYIATTGTGRLRMNVGTSALLFPVGPDANATNYNPISLSQTSGADTFAVRVKIGFDHPTNGTDYVDRQWNIDRSPGNSTAATAIFGWATGHQSGNFDPADCHVSRWNGSSWDAFASGAASCVAGICERTQSGITSFSPFGVATGQSLLPIELTFFNAQKITEKTARLTWQTASENNNEGFEIQRSGNGTNWQTIGFKNGKGTTADLSDYFFEDENPLDGPNFYRLRQLDFDGKTSFSNIEHLEFGSPEEESFRLYPNPAFAGDALIFVWKNSHEPETELTIFDALGRPVFSQKLEPTNSDLEQMGVNTLRFAAGWHTARLRSGDRAMVKKFLVTGY